MDNCKVEVEAMSDHDYLKPYTSDVLVFKEGEFNFKYAKTWIDELKEPNWQRCSYNSMIFITNRIIDFGAIGDQDIYEVTLHLLKLYVTLNVFSTFKIHVRICVLN